MMHQGAQKGTTDGANALGSRLLCVLFAILALCATPLGTGELFAAECQVHERGRIEAQGGDQPARFAMHGDPAGTFETVGEPGRPMPTPVLLDEGAGALAGNAPLNVGDTGVVPAALASPGIACRAETGFEARAPPRT